MVAGCLAAFATTGCQVNIGDGDQPFNNGGHHRREPKVYTYDERNSLDRLVAGTNDLPPPTKPAPEIPKQAKPAVVKKPVACTCSGTTHKSYTKPAPADKKK
jgi:hypothetical protein